MMSIQHLFISTALVCLLSACNGTGSTTTEIDTLMVLTPDNQAIHVEVADTAEERAQGLMFRESLREDRGMLFVFNDERPRSFWMKNTLIPLDAIFLDADHTIVSIQTMAPCVEEENLCPSYPSGEAALFAIEVNAGVAEKLDLQVGDRLSIPPPPHPALSP